jgi:methylthioxylose transferase
VASVTRSRPVLPAAGLATAAAVIAVGLTAHASGDGLGLPLAPFLMYWGPQVDGLVAVTVVAIAGALWVAPAIVERLRSPFMVAASLYALALVLGLALNLAHEGTRGWWAVFATGHGGSEEGLYEYLPGLRDLSHGIPYFLRHFGALLRLGPVHVQGNPPGPLIALHLLGIGGATGMAALCIGLGTLCAPLAYDLGRVLGDERRGRVAGVLTAFSPSLMLFGVTSADYAFAALGMVVACLLVRRSGRAVLAGSCAAAIATFCSWLLFAIPAWATIVVLRRDGLRAALRLAAACAVAICAWNGALALACGYDPFSALHATITAYNHEATSTTRAYWFYLLGAPTAWGVMMGLPIMWLTLRALSRRDACAVALGVVLVLASVLGVTNGETERVWLPFVPLACVAAAAAEPASRLRRRPLLLLAGQALIVELLFFTVW